MIKKIIMKNFRLKQYSTIGATFIFNIIDSLLYSYATTYIVSQGTKNNLVILLVGGVAAVILYLLSTHQLLVGKIKLYVWVIILFISFNWLLVFDFKGVSSLLLIYFIEKIAVGAISTLLSNQILSEASNVKKGFMNSATLNVVTVLVGFAIGSSLYQVQPSKFGLLLILLLIMILIFIMITHPKLLTLQLVEDNDNFVENGRVNIHAKQYFLILGVMSSVSVIWIPQLLVAFQHEHLNQVWFPFVVPGIATLIFLTVFRHVKKMNLIIYPGYILVSLFFLVVYGSGKSAVISTIIFSLVQGFGQLTQITIRSDYIEANQGISRKILLQTLVINNQLFLIVISLLKFAQLNVGVIALVINIVSVIYLIFEQKYKKVSA